MTTLEYNRIDSAFGYTPEGFSQVMQRTLSQCLGAESAANMKNSRRHLHGVRKKGTIRGEKCIGGKRHAGTTQGKSMQSES